MTKPHTPGAPAPITAKAVFDAAFTHNTTRTPRSPAYAHGALSALMLRLGEAGTVACPYEPGTSEFDAFQAGVDEGHRLAREALGGAQ